MGGENFEGEEFRVVPFDVVNCLLNFIGEDVRGDEGRGFSQWITF